MFKETSLRNGQRSRNDIDTMQEENAARAAGQVYFGVLIPFLRRALGEGVYGVKDGYGFNPDGVEDGGEDSTGKVLEGVVREWEGWLKTNESKA